MTILIYDFPAPPPPRQGEPVPPPPRKISTDSNGNVLRDNRILYPSTSSR